MHFPFVRLEWRVKMAHANPSFTIRNPVNPVHPVSNIDWTGLREEQDYSPPASSVPRHFHSPKAPIPRHGYAGRWALIDPRSEEHTSELQSRGHLVCPLLLDIKNHQANC